ncbi:hypothetical protein CI109_103965 [Kwoniella shandongensis]|uniref:Uncharacterized protein n=1 Tax=Kwoniella shandongensis TaxID=1734106 RepID=A0A5M6C0S9_9TREE|nr:uncharacterized protein CI109_004151 [Kwoniella shandongensis]KAA5527612.1 hypothetical protein CI109_004151 [Kwoniella shandongensis]
MAPLRPLFTQPLTPAYTIHSTSIPRTALRSTHQHAVRAAVTITTSLTLSRPLTTSLIPLTTSSASSSTSSSSSILAEAVATTHLSWWQLLALILGVIIAIVVGGWMWWRHRRKERKSKEKKVAEMKEREKDKKEKEMLDRLAGVGKGRGDSGEKRKGRRRRKRGRRGVSESESETETESDWSEDWSESDDSISDGGTIRPSKTRRRRGRGRSSRRKKYGHSRSRRRGGGGGGRYDSDSETDFSDETYLPPRRNRRDRNRKRDRYEDEYYTRERDRNRDRGRRKISPSPPPPAQSTRPPKPTRQSTSSSQGTIPSHSATAKHRTFRDSVFSSYNSMKKAAVRLKYVEAKVKLKKQLEEEEALERKRREKVREANRELEEMNAWEREQERAQEGSSSVRLLCQVVDAACGIAAAAGQLLIPPIKRSSTGNSSSSSNVSRPSLPIPPRRAGTTRSGTAESQIRPAQIPPRGDRKHRQLYPPSPAKVASRPERIDTEDSLGIELSYLLDNGEKSPSHPLGHTEQSKNRSLDGMPKPPLRSNLKKPSAQLPPRAQPKRPSASQNQQKTSNWNPFQADWLSHPIIPPVDAATSVETKRERSGSVYLPITDPRERPTIPKGKLAAAPLGRSDLNQTGSSDQGRETDVVQPGRVGVGGGVGNGASGSKWADRLRDRRK